jgi:hypothetical protein
VLPRLKSSGMDIAEFPRVLEGAWNHALPGHEAAERDAPPREIWRNSVPKSRVYASRFAFVWSAASHDGRGRICRRR